LALLAELLALLAELLALLAELLALLAELLALSVWYNFRAVCRARFGYVCYIQGIYTADRRHV